MNRPIEEVAVAPRLCFGDALVRDTEGHRRDYGIRASNSFGGDVLGIGYQPPFDSISRSHLYASRSI
jgi:hypothetical protein